VFKLHFTVPVNKTKPWPTCDTSWGLIHVAIKRESSRTLLNTLETFECHVPAKGRDIDKKTILAITITEGTIK